MLFLTICSLLLLAFINYRLSGRALFHPGVVFCSAWAAGLLLISLCGDLFYPLSPKTLMNFLAGAVAFSVGTAMSSLGLALKPAKPAAPQPASNRILNTFLCLVLVSAPVAIRWMLNAIAQHPAGNFLVQASMTMLDERLRDDPSYVFFGNVATLACIVTMIAFVERKHHQKRWLLSASVTLIVIILSAGRGAIVLGIFSIICMDWIKARRIRLKLALALGCVFICLVSAIAIYLGKAGASTEASLQENVVPVAQGIALYATGSLVAYDRVVRQPNITPHNWRITRFFEQRLSRIDKSFKAPSEVLEYATVGPNQLMTNTYTFFFALIDLGSMGMLLVFAGLGWLVGVSYHRAIRGSPIAVLLYGALFSGILLSLFGDYFFNNLNYMIKLFVVGWCVYELPCRWVSLKTFFATRVTNLTRLKAQSPI